MVQGAGRSTATLSSTCPRYKKLTSNRRSEKETGTPACVTPPCPSTRVKLESANPSSTRLVLPRGRTLLKARARGQIRGKPRQAPTPCRSRGCTAPHPPPSQAFCMGPRSRPMSLARNPVVFRLAAGVLASTAARLPSPPSLLLAGHSRRTPMILPLALAHIQAAAVPARLPPPLRGPLGQPLLRLLRHRAHRT